MRDHNTEDPSEYHQEDGKTVGNKLRKNNNLVTIQTLAY